RRHPDRWRPVKARRRRARPPVPEAAEPALRRGSAPSRPHQRSRHPVRAVAPVRIRVPAPHAGRDAAAQRRARRRVPAVQHARRAAARDPQPADAALVRPRRGAPGAHGRRCRARRGPQLSCRQPRDRLLAAGRAHAPRRRRHARAAAALHVPPREPDRLLDPARRPLARGGDRPHLRPGGALGAARRSDAAESARAAQPSQLRRVHDPGEDRVRRHHRRHAGDDERRGRGDDRGADRCRARRRAQRLDPRRRLHRPRAGPDGRRRRRRRLGPQRGAAQERQEEAQVSSVLPGAQMKRLAIGPAELPWWIALGGFAAMYLPLYWWAAFSENALWQTDEHGHGALILLVLVWLFWGMREAIFAAPTRPSRGLGWTLFAIGLLLYVVGQVVGIAIFMFGSQPFIVAAILLLLRGPDAVRIAWFALFYFIFMIPLPGIFVDTVTGPLKQWISVIVVELLYRVGYPISRTGVIISIGQYQMLVADACSGLHSMYSLSALGTLFMYRSEEHTS